MIEKKKIGIIGIGFGNNIGNNLLKYAIFIKLKELGFDPYIIGNLRNNANIICCIVFHLLIKQLNIEL